MSSTLYAMDGALVGHSAHVGLVLLDACEQVVWCSEGARRLIDTSEDLCLRANRLHATTSEINIELRSAIQSCLERARDTRSVYVLRMGCLSRHSSIHLVISSNEDLKATSAVRILIGSSTCRRISPLLLQRLYLFSAAEARVVSELVAGCSVAEISARLRVQSNTVRIHLKSAYAKTETRN